MVRKDWMDKLGLEEPSTLDEMADLLRAFITEDPDGNGQDDTVGLVVHNEVYGGYPNNTFAVDNIFTAFDAYPSVWIKDESGNAVYGSVQPEMKDALQLMRDWYAEGLIDKEFTTRTYDDIVALLSSGQCGAYIGPWWSPFNPARPLPTVRRMRNGSTFPRRSAPMERSMHQHQVLRRFRGCPQGL